MPRPDHRKGKDAFHTSYTAKGTQDWDPLFLKLSAQDVYQDIVICPCNFQKMLPGPDFSDEKPF
jgi:hypothetical protein